MAQDSPQELAPCGSTRCLSQHSCQWETSCTALGRLAGAPSDILDGEDPSGQDGTGQESARSEAGKQQQAVLLALQKGQPVKLLSVTPEQHTTRPPPRYTEASLVKALEELGIGRPSTYASILKVLQVTNASLCAT